jgi:hypothetical protein
MLNIVRNVTTIAAFLALAGAVAAQDPDWYQQREDRYRAEHWKAHMFAEIRTDLDHVQSTAFSGHDEHRIVRTKQDLDDLQSALAAGRYEEPKLDEVIGSLQRVVEDNRMSKRDRDMLNDDLERLHNYREHHAEWEH